MEGTCKAGVVLLNFHEQLISGIYLGKGLLVVLMFLELGPVYRSFMLPFFNFFFFLWWMYCIYSGTVRWAHGGVGIPSPIWPAYCTGRVSVFVQSGHTECLRNLEKRPRRLQLIYVTNLFPLQPTSETRCPPQHSFHSWLDGAVNVALLGVAAIGQAALTLVA